MTSRPSSDFDKFQDFVRKVVSVPQSEIKKIKDEEAREKKIKKPTKPKP